MKEDTLNTNFLRSLASVHLPQPPSQSSVHPSLPLPAIPYSYSHVQQHPQNLPMDGRSPMAQINTPPHTQQKSRLPHSLLFSGKENTPSHQSFPQAFIQESPSVSTLSPMDTGKKPPYSYSSLIGMAILSSPEQRLTLAQIYLWISTHFSHYKLSDNEKGNGKGWQNSIRHNLSLNKAFRKLEKAKDGKGCYWGVNPGFEDGLLKSKSLRIQKSTKKSVNGSILSSFNNNVSLMSPSLSSTSITSTTSHQSLPLPDNSNNNLITSTPLPTKPRSIYTLTQQEDEEGLTIETEDTNATDPLSPSSDITTPVQTHTDDLKRKLFSDHDTDEEDSDDEFKQPIKRTKTAIGLSHPTFYNSNDSLTPIKSLNFNKFGTPDLNLSISKKTILQPPTSSNSDTFNFSSPSPSKIGIMNNIPTLSAPKTNWFPQVVGDIPVFRSQARSPSKSPSQSRNFTTTASFNSKTNISPMKLIDPGPLFPITPNSKLSNLAKPILLQTPKNESSSSNSKDNNYDESPTSSNRRSILRRLWQSPSFIFPFDDSCISPTKSKTPGSGTKDSSVRITQSLNLSISDSVFRGSPLRHTNSHIRTNSKTLLSSTPNSNSKHNNNNSLNTVNEEKMSQLWGSPCRKQYQESSTYPYSPHSLSPYSFSTTFSSFSALRGELDNEADGDIFGVDVYRTVERASSSISENFGMARSNSKTKEGTDDDNNLADKIVELKATEDNENDHNEKDDVDSLNYGDVTIEIIENDKDNTIDDSNSTITMPEQEDESEI